jgi:hypothetical protein
MAGNAKCLWRCRDQLNAGYIFIDSDFVTTGAPHGNGRMHEFAFAFVFMAFQALRGTGVRLQGNWVDGGGKVHCPQEKRQTSDYPYCNPHNRLHL